MKRYSSIKVKKSKSQLQRENNALTNYSISTIYKIIFLNSLSAALIYLFLSNSWSEVSSTQVKVQGNKLFDKKEIIQASGLLLPEPLLEIIPKRIEKNLARELSLQAVSVHRQILPTKLVIEILEREPIAYAQRVGALGIEKGMIDKNAEWIPIKSISENQPEIKLSVNGWDYNYRDLIGFILKQQQNLGSSLEKINLSSNGEIILKTKYFSSINLGSNPEMLSDQIKVLEHLSKTLPPSFIKQKETTIDLRDPSKPELQTGTLK